MQQMRKCLKKNFSKLLVTQKIVSLLTADCSMAIQVRPHVIKCPQQIYYTQCVLNLM